MNEHDDRQLDFWFPNFENKQSFCILLIVICCLSKVSFLLIVDVSKMIGQSSHDSWFTFLCEDLLSLDFFCVELGILLTSKVWNPLFLGGDFVRTKSL